MSTIKFIGGFLAPVTIGAAGFVGGESYYMSKTKDLLENRVVVVWKESPRHNEMGDYWGLGPAKVSGKFRKGENIVQKDWVVWEGAGPPREILFEGKPPEKILFEEKPTIKFKSDGYRNTSCLFELGGILTALAWVAFYNRKVLVPAALRYVTRKG